MIALMRLMILSDDGDEGDDGSEGGNDGGGDNDCPLSFRTDHQTTPGAGPAPPPLHSGFSAGPPTHGADLGLASII